jgi:hypothetical protein
LATVMAAALVGCDRAPRVAAAGDARAVLKRYCVDCHNDAEYAGAISFERAPELAALLRDAAVRDGGRR